MSRHTKTEYVIDALPERGVVVLRARSDGRPLVDMDFDPDGAEAIGHQMIAAARRVREANP
jgi:hypothetical protein